MGGRLEKRQTVLKRSHEILNHTVFGNRDEEDGTLREVVYIPTDTVVAMGLPVEVTITIEPGDKLNP